MIKAKEVLNEESKSEDSVEVDESQISKKRDRKLTEKVLQKFGDDISVSISN